MEEARRTFIPAAGRDWCLPLYDPLVRLMGVDEARRALVAQAGLRSGQAALDVGCGTGSLAVLLKAAHPGVDVVAVDPDPKALERARRKAARAGVSLRLDRAFAGELPYPDASFDRVLCSFVFHHLQGKEKAGMLGEARRVLKPGGSLHLLDLAGPGAGSDGFVAGWLASRPLLRDNAEGRVLELMGEAGLQDPTRMARGTLVVGLFAYRSYRAAAPTPEACHAC